MTGNTCAFKSKHLHKLPFSLDENDTHYIQLKTALTLKIKERIKEGYSIFISGMAWGMDIIFFEIVLSLKQEYPHIKLIAAIPYEEQPKKWREGWRNRYFYALEQANEIYMQSQRYTPDCISKCKKWMIDQSNHLIAVWDGTPGGTKTAITYARKRGLKLTIINPLDSLAITENRVK